MKKKYYIILTPFFPTEDNFRGPFIFDQAKALAKYTEYDILVLKLVHHGEETAYTYQSIKVFPVKIKDLPSFILPGLFLKQNLVRLIKKLKEITGDQLNNIEYLHGHVTYASGIMSVALADKIGARSIVQHHGLDVMSYTNGRFQKSFFNKINKWWINSKHLPILNRATWNIGVSKKTIDQLHGIPGYMPTKEMVLHNGVDLSKFYQKEKQKDNSVFTIGCIGNFWVTKDQITLIKAFHKFVSLPTYKNSELKLVGTGSELLRCKEYVEAYHLKQKIHFIDSIDHADLVDFYNSLDLFVLPSYDEAFGCVYTEAFACGVPFIGIKGQGIEEMILPENKTYQLISKGNVNELCALLQQYHDGLRIQDLAEDWNITSLTIKYLTAISNPISKNFAS